MQRPAVRQIVWLLRPRTPAGQPDLDHLNPDPSLRQRHLCGLTIIWGLQPEGPSHWTNGWLYDPKDGVTYDVTAELTASNTISARIYRGVPLFGRTEILIRDPQLQLRRTLLSAGTVVLTGPASSSHRTPSWREVNSNLYGAFPVKWPFLVFCRFFVRSWKAVLHPVA